MEIAKALKTGYYSLGVVVPDAPMAKCAVCVVSHSQKLKKELENPVLATRGKGSPKISFDMIGLLSRKSQIQESLHRKMQVSEAKKTVG